MVRRMYGAGKAKSGTESLLRVTLIGPGATAALCALAFVLAVFAGLVMAAAEAESAVATRQSVAVPAYFQPGATWNRMQAAYPTVRLAVMNPDSGPGSAYDPRYAAQVSRSRAAGLSVIGYVYTDYGTRSLPEVQADIDKYYAWYGVDGVFLDQVDNTSCQYAESYYSALYRYVKGKGGAATVVLNPGAQTQECYMSVADTIVNFEGSYTTYSTRYSAPAWVSKYPSNRFWHIVYRAPTGNNMENAVRLSKQRNAGYVYVTQDVLPNPYDTLPSGGYWSKELAAVSRK